MIYLRSALFNVLFFLNLLGLMIVSLPALAMNRHAVFAVARTWARSSLWLLRVICNIEVEFRGLENIPKGGFLIAPKHQSVWETFALCLFFPDFTFILKRELMWVPFFGWYLWRADQIAINRASGSAALNEAAQRSREILKQGRQVFIFPEGTRRPAGAPAAYKFGVAHIYSQSGAPCLPVALNSGLFWPRRSFIKRPGCVLVEFLEPIAPGLDRSEFFKLLQQRMETSTDRLIAESLSKDPSLKEVIEQNAAGK